MTILVGRRAFGPSLERAGIIRMRRSAGLLRMDAIFGVSLYQLSPDYAGGGDQPQERFAQDRTLFADRRACKLVARYCLVGEVEGYFGHCFFAGEYSATQQCEQLLLKVRRGERENRCGHKYVLITSGRTTKGFEVYELGVEEPILEAMYGVTGPCDPGAMFGVSENFVYILAPDRPGPFRVHRKRELERRIFGSGTVDAAELAEAYLILVPGMERHRGRLGGSDAAREFMKKARANPMGSDYALALALRVEEIPGLKRVMREARDFARLRPLPHGAPCAPSRFVLDGHGKWLEVLCDSTELDDIFGPRDKVKPDSADTGDAICRLESESQTV